jgi:hypothetical protein
MITATVNRNRISNLLILTDECASRRVEVKLLEQNLFTVVYDHHYCQLAGCAVTAVVVTVGSTTTTTSTSQYWHWY